MNTLNTYPVEVPRATAVAEQSNGFWRSRVGRTIGRAATGVAAVVSAMVGMEAADQDAAQATAYTKGVSAPYSTGDRVEGKADIGKNCDGTLGCWAYLKVEVKPEPKPGMPPWIGSNGWQYAGGKWAGDGQNTVSVPLRSGCAEYRTVVDTYNDLPAEMGSVGASVGYKGVGEIGATRTINGVERYHVMARSAVQRICMMA